jgi:hypothetical protein
MTMTHAMTPAKCIACGLATNTVTVDGSNTHERVSWRCRHKTLVTAAINTDHEEAQLVALRTVVKTIQKRHWWWIITEE